MRVLKIPKCKRAAYLSFAPDGRHLVIVTSPVDDYVESIVWVDVATGQPGRSVALDAERCALAPDHSRIAISFSVYNSANQGGTFVRHATVPAESKAPDWVEVPDLPHEHVFALAFSPDGKRLAIGCSSESTGEAKWSDAIHIAPAGRGEPVTIPVDRAVGELAFSPDGRWLVSSGGPEGDPAIYFHRHPDPKPAAVYRPKATRTRRLVFAPDRPLLAALAGKQVVLLEVGRHEPVAVLDRHTARVDGAAFAPDGRRLLTAGQDGTVRVWDATAATAAGTFTWPAGKLTAVAVAPDGLTAAAAGEKGQVVVWDLEG